MSSRTPSLSNVPEESGAFAIGDDDSEDEAGFTTAGGATTGSRPADARSSSNSRASSISSPVDDAVPQQFRGMSEKARGKMPVGQSSRNDSVASLGSLGATVVSSTGSFVPTREWVRFILFIGWTSTDGR